MKSYSISKPRPYFDNWDEPVKADWSNICAIRLESALEAMIEKILDLQSRIEKLEKQDAKG